MDQPTTRQPDAVTDPKRVEPVLIPPPGVRLRRNATFAAPGERRSRYSLPTDLDSPSPVGYRTRVSLTRDEAEKALSLLSLERPTGFAPAQPISEGELFEESSLGVLTARQSTNFKGHRQVTLGPEDSARAAGILRGMKHLDGTVLDGASHTHVVLSRPYRTKFTLLLTLIGHKPLLSLFTVPLRAIRKALFHIDDIPSVGYLQQLHIGILADAMERAAVIASGGQRLAQVQSTPFAGREHHVDNRGAIRDLEALCGITPADRAQGWRICLVTQVGTALPGEGIDLDPALCRKLGANLMAFRSERIQPGVNQDDKATEPYRQQQDMDVPDDLTVMAGRAAYNAFAHWTGCDREEAKRLLLLERIDVLTANGKERLRDVQQMLNRVTDRIIKGIPLWADLPTGKIFSRSAHGGRKAFGLAGQRIYIGGLSRPEVESAGLVWDAAVRAVGAASSRSGLVAEIMGVTEVPDDCDMLAGLCLMAGPVNQNDVGKTFFGDVDLLHKLYGDRNPTSLIVWTLKAKTVTDPIGNEEQLMNPAQQGPLVDLRPGPHDIIAIRERGASSPMRLDGTKVNAERAYGDMGNFVTDPEGREIPGNAGSRWPQHLRDRQLWSGDR